MDNFSREIQLRWSDLDPNLHVRHSVYYDWAAFARIAYLAECGIDTVLLQQLKVGPILFREECIFRKEIRLEDKPAIFVELVASRRDFSRWTIRHRIMKQDTLCAMLTVDGAWLDIIKRKLTAPPPQVNEAFLDMPRADTFGWSDE